jgi:hypothetical protein
MPDPAGTHNDGGMVFGSQIVSLLNGATAVDDYIAENITLDSDSNLLESKDELGRPNKEVMIEQNPTGAATLQLESATTKLPKIGYTFKIRPIAGAVDGTSDVTVKIKKVGQAFQQDGETKVSVDIRGKLN